MKSTNCPTKNKKAYTLLELLTAKQQARDSNKGYTLLELLIVISLITIVFTFGFARYQDFQRRQQLEAASRTIRADLRLAQEYSLAGRKPDTPSGNDCEGSSLNGYIFMRLDQFSYQIDADCTDGTVTVIGPKSVDSSLTISSIPSGSGAPSNQILFRVLGRGVNRPGDTNIILTQTATGATTTITVSPSGEIR